MHNQFPRLHMDCNDHLYIYDGAHATGNFRVRQAWSWSWCRPWWLRWRCGWRWWWRQRQRWPRRRWWCRLKLWRERGGEVEDNPMLSCLGENLIKRKPSLPPPPQPFLPPGSFRLLLLVFLQLESFHLLTCSNLFSLRFRTNEHLSFQPNYILDVLTSFRKTYFFVLVRVGGPQIWDKFPNNPKNKFWVRT